MSRIISRGREEGVREDQLKGKVWGQLLRYWGCSVLGWLPEAVWEHW